MFPAIEWSLISFELWITAILVILVIADLFFVPKDSGKDILATLSFLGLCALSVVWMNQGGLSGMTFGGMFVVDSLSWFFKGFFILAMFFIFVMTQEFFKSSRRNEFYLLLWLAFLGMSLVSSAADFLMLFLSVEILTLSLYVMTAYLRSDKFSLEAGMKYLILGSLSSGFMLYGISMLYGAAHSTRFEAIAAYASTHPMEPLALLGLILVFASVGFKIAAVPFQMWVPDVYQGAPTPVTALLSVGSKAAGFIMVIRLFFCIFPGWYPHWSMVLAVLSAVTMTYGNLVAMFQTNIKRLLGYSSVGHAGYLLMGVAAGSMLGVSAINFYLLSYLFTNLAAFLVIVIFYLAVKSDEIEDYAGLAQRSGILAATLLFALVSLAGIPPLAGFFGKFSLLMAVVKRGYIWLALIAVVNIIISMYYYLNVARRIYADAPRTHSPIAVSPTMKLILGVSIAGIVVIGIFQGPFLTAAIASAQGMFIHP